MSNPAHPAVVKNAKNAELTLKQAQAAAKNPKLYAMFKGERIDTFAKEAVNSNRILQALGVRSTPRFVRGADFTLSKSNVWWDITTKGQWAKHVAKYGSNGIRLKY